MSIGELLAEVIVPGPPVQWMRAAGRAGGGRRTVERDAAHRADIALCAAVHRLSLPPETPVHVDCLFLLAIDPGHQANIRELMRSGALLPTGKKTGDLDNYVKAVLDACNGILYADDCQVASMMVRKLWSADPRTEIRIHRVT